MSYCVNCGVELEVAQKNCPLCGVVVINPLQPPVTEQSKTFPQQKDEVKKKDRMFWIKFISVLLAVPIFTCVLSNLLFDHRLTWSIYVIAGVFILWVLSTSPLYFRRFDYRKMLLADMLAVLLGLLIIEAQAPGQGWVFVIALPIVLYCFSCCLAIIYVTDLRKISGLGIAAAAFLSVALMLPGIEVLLDLYLSNTVSLIWSWFVIAPCIAIAILLILLNKNKRFRQELAKRLHI